MLPKIHKTNSPGRPIVSACNAPTVVISEFLDGILKPIVQNLPTYIKDSKEAVVLFKDYTFSSASAYLFTMDVTALYTSIPIQDGLSAMRHFIELDNSIKYPASTILRLAELVLNTTAFNFNGKFFRQVSGISMGTKMGPNFACLFMGYFEQNVLRDYKGKKPDLFKRYIDDCVGVMSGTLDELNEFINFVNNFHPAIKFTHEISDKCVPFLDISLSIDKPGLSTSVHYKDTDAHTYLNYNSSHPPACKNAIPYSQLVRLRRLCSDDDDFNIKASEMIDFFNAREYPSDITVKSLRKVCQLTHEDTLQPTHNTNACDRIPLVLTYHPMNKKVINIVRDNFSILTEDK
ncbi:uncharacterized protein [Antedon mediterranea]|uniref:uncharacterized protein n=1 Tax=Antedon mediterranea TaxID=105859 RepID=UPI003AF5E77D